MLKQSRLAGHQRGRGKAKDLPKRKVPGHDRQHDAKRLKAHETSRRISRDMFVDEMPLGILRVIATNPDALFRLLYRAVDWLTHLERHRAGKTLLFALKNFRCAVHHDSAVMKCGAAMFAKNGGSATQLLFKFTFIERFKCFEDLTRSRINR